MLTDKDNFEKLLKILDEILKENKEMSVRAIAWLHFIRYHPVFNSQYQILFSAKYKFVFFLIMLYLRGIVNIILTLLKSILVGYSYNYLCKRKNVDIFYVSHLINPNVDNKKDFYFDDIISKLGDKGFSIAGLLINHIKTNLTDDIKKKVRAKNNYILNNYLDFKTEIKFATTQIKVFLKFLFKLENNQLKRRINLLISGFSISRSTFLNIRLSSVFKNLISFHNPKLVLITYEGHAWERILCNTLKINFNKSKIIGYQHSYIFENQHAALNSFDFNFDPHYILTSGEISKERIIKSNIAKNIKVDILGSKRFGDTNKLKIQPSKKFSKRIFVIPEGIESESRILFDFCLNYSSQCQDLEFVFKLHPQMSLDYFISKNPEYKKMPKNCHWFTNHSFKSSDWVLYRGSTFIVELLKKGLQPIYLSHKSDYGSIDIFEGKFNHRKIISSTKDLDLLIKKENIGKLTNDKELNSLLDFSNKIYSPVNSSVLNKIIREVS